MSDPSPRTYTLSEANDALETVRPLVETLHRAHREMDERSEAVTTSISTNGGGEVHRVFLDAAGHAARALEALLSMDIVVRDPETGLIDFYSERDGEVVFLCWRLGEDAVAWWHPLSTGIAGRQRVEGK